MEDYKYEEARRDTIIKWKWFAKNTYSEFNYEKNFINFKKEHENLSKLRSYCGFCEYFKVRVYCTNCPLQIDFKISNNYNYIIELKNIQCGQKLHPWNIFFNYTNIENAKEVLDLVLSTPEKEEDLIKKEN